MSCQEEKKKIKRVVTIKKVLPDLVVLQLFFFLVLKFYLGLGVS